VNSRATAAFWAQYHALPTGAQRLADKAYRLWRENHWHPSLHFKKVGNYWVARISDDYRAVGIESAGTVAWFWIGRHKDYERLIA
jgi:hypothetical protein